MANQQAATKSKKGKRNVLCSNTGKQATDPPTWEDKGRSTVKTQSKAR